FWLAKFARNVARDRRAAGQLRRLGWGVMVVWECQTTPAGHDRLARRIERFLAGEERPARRAIADGTGRSLEARGSRPLGCAFGKPRETR
ncbi:MAG TPA: hypothetical protein VF170_17500, partial [Planctomycetaceae bacterium]